MKQERLDSLKNTLSRSGFSEDNHRLKPEGGSSLGRSSDCTSCTVECMKNCPTSCSQNCSDCSTCSVGASKAGS